VVASLQDAGKNVPNDISELGFNDNLLAARIRPRLTTVHQPFTLIAQKSIERLLEIHRTHDMASFTLSYELVERESCCLNITGSIHPPRMAAKISCTPAGSPFRQSFASGSLRRFDFVQCAAFLLPANAV